MIGNLILRWLLNTVALLVVAIALAPHFSYDSLMTVAIAALVLGLLNTLVKPLLGNSAKSRLAEMYGAPSSPCGALSM